MNFNRFLTLFLIVEFIIAGVFISSAISRAIDLDELGLSRPDYLDANTIREESGLDSGQYGQCDESFYDINGLLEGLNEEAGNILQDALGSGFDAFISCIGDNLASTWTFFTTALGSGGGGRFGGAIEQCVKVSLSDTKAELRAQYERRLQANNMVGCTTATGNDSINQTVTAMLHTQGPDGGPAYVTDYNEWLNLRPERMAQRRIWSILANTKLCPHIKEYILDTTGVPQSYRDKPPSLGADGLAVDGGTPPALRWQCTLPEGYDADWSTDESFAASGGVDGIIQAANGPNDPNTLLRMIGVEYQKQVEAMKKVADSMANGGSGGFLPVMSECIGDPEKEACIRYGAIKQVPGSMQDIIDSNRDALQDEWNAATGEQGQNSDIANRIRVQLLDLANAPLPLEFEAGPETNNDNYQGIPTPTPDPNHPSPTPDPTDPVCNGSNPACECPPPGNPSTWANLATLMIAPKIAEVRQTNPGLFINYTPEIYTGRERDVLQAVCDRIQARCHPHASLNDRIVLDLNGSTQVSFVIITADGFVRVDGGSASAMCTDGSM